MASPFPHATTRAISHDELTAAIVAALDYVNRHYGSDPMHSDDCVRSNGLAHLIGRIQGMMPYQGDNYQAIEHAYQALSNREPFLLTPSEREGSGPF
jgi:hypothetical protein